MGWLYESHRIANIDKRKLIFGGFHRFVDALHTQFTKQMMACVCLFDRLLINTVDGFLNFRIFSSRHVGMI